MRDAPIEILLDMRDAICPMPVQRAKRALRSMASGERLRVLATDRDSLAGFQAFCRETGHTLRVWSEENGVFSFIIISTGSMRERSRHLTWMTD